MDLKRIRYFCAVIEQGGINKAARVLYMAQPPLSKRIQELETELDVQLFHRTDRKLEPTAAGLYFYERACTILHDIDDATRQTQRMSGIKVIRIGMTHLYQKYFNNIAVELIKRNDNIEFEISIADSGSLEQQLQKQQIDIALVQRPAHNDNYECISLGCIDNIALVGNETRLAAGKKAISFLELSKIPLILIKRSCGRGIYEVLLNQFKTIGATPNVILNISQPTGIVSWIDSGVCAASILPASEIDQDELKNSTIMPLAGGPELFFPTVVKLKKSSYVNEVMDVIRDWLAQA